MNDIFTAAVEETKRGCVIHPLSNPNTKEESAGKRPLLKNWSKRAQPATEEELKKWFDGTGNNIGIVCGQASNRTIVDFDQMLFYYWIFGGIGAGADTRRSQRTEGREHIHYTNNRNIPSQKHHDLGIEILSDGSNAVLPPSIHKSGDVYRWENPDSPIIAMPEEVEKKIIRLFEIEAELKRILSKCRHCFRTAIKNRSEIDWNGAEGREYMLAVCTDLKANGASEEHVKMLATLAYREKYDEAKTLKEWGNIDPTKTWRCDKLREKLPTYVDPAECDECKTRRQAYKNEQTKNSVVHNGAFGYIDHVIEKTPIYYDTAHNYWMWDIEEGYYKMVDDTELLLTILREIADPAIIKSHFKHQLLEGIRLRGRDARVKDVPAHWIHVKNGVIDIKTNEVFSSSPEYLFTEPIPHNISQSEETPTIDKLFSEWVAQDKIPLLYEICAYCLYNGYPIHRMFILVGRGRNGKGQYRDIIVRLVGVKNRTASTLEQLMNSRFESARLQYKKICTMGEINYTFIERTAILKMLSGGDPIPAERKNKEPYDFVNTAKMLINTNSIPSTADKTDAWYSRCLSIEFPNQFQKGKDIIDTIPDEEYDNLLTKCIRVLRELLERGEFTNEGDIQEKEREYERLSNPLTQFIQNYCDKNVDYFEATWRIYDQYEMFCTEKGYKKPSSKTEFNSLLGLNYEVEKKNLRDYVTKEYKKWVWVFGIKLKNLPVLPVLPDIHIDSLYDKPSENMGKTGKTGKNNISNGTEQHTQMSYNSSAFLGKKNDNSAVIKACQEWESNHQEKINSENLTKACFYLKPMFPDINMDDLANHIKKIAKITPINGNGSEDSDQKNPQHPCSSCGAIPAKNTSESSLKQKEYYCAPCYKNLCEKRGAKI